MKENMDIVEEYGLEPFEMNVQSLERTFIDIKGGVKKQLPDGVYEKATVLHLRGAIDYTKLSFKHKTMMGLLVRKAKNLPAEKKNAEVYAMIETYNQVVDYDSLNSIIDELKVI